MGLRDCGIIVIIFMGSEKSGDCIARLFINKFSTNVIVDIKGEELNDGNSSCPLPKNSHEMVESISCRNK